MTLDITVDYSSGELSMLLDNHLILRAIKNTEDSVEFSPSFSQLDDEPTIKVLKEFSRKLLNLDQV
jgi:hypothetical protein